MVRNRWRTFPYAMDDDLSRSHSLIPAPHSDNLFELLGSFEDGMEPYDIELSQYIVLEDKVVCFVGTYRESFYNHETGDYKWKKKRHWFGIAYQTSIPYSKLIERYLEARQNYDDWWAKMLIAEKLQKERFKKEGGDTIMPHHGMERNRLYKKEPLKPWIIFEEYMWRLDGKNWNRSYRVYDYFIEGTNRKDAKERILEQAQNFVSTEPDWFKNPRQEIFEKRRGMKKKAETFEANDMIKERYFEKQLKKYEDKLDWDTLSQNPSLTPALIEKYEDKLYWSLLSQNPSLTPALIEKYEDKWNWKYLSMNPSLTPALIEKYEDKLKWNYLSFNPSLTPALIEKYENKLDWGNLSENPSLTPAFIEKYKDKLDWNYLSRNPSLTPALIEKYELSLYWKNLSMNPSLTPALIEKYKDKLNWSLLSDNPALTPAIIEKYEKSLYYWRGLSENPSLTPALIEKYKDKLDWNYLSSNPALFGNLHIQKKAETFEANDMIKERYFEKQLKKYGNKLDWYYLSRNPSLTPTLIEKYIDKLNWYELSMNPSLTPTLIEKYIDKLNWYELSMNPSLNPTLIEKYIEKYIDKLNLPNLSKNPSLTPALIEKYEYKLHWDRLSLNPSLTPALIEKYEDKLYWNYLSLNPSLTPALIEKYENKLGWRYLSQNPSLTPALIEKYIDDLHWDYLSQNPSLTPALIEKYEDKLDWSNLSHNPSLTPALIEKYKDKLDWDYLSENPALTPAVIKKYEKKLHWPYLSANSALFGNLHIQKKAEESNNPSAEEILDFVIKQFSKGELTVNSKMIGEHFNIEPIEVQYITNRENVRDKYKVEGESAFGDFFLRYKEIPFQSAYNNGLYYASMKNPWVKARAIGRKYEPKQKRKARLKRILYGAEGIGSKGMLAAGIVVAFTLIPEIKKAFLNNKKDK